MDFAKVITQRKMIRKYQNRPVDPAALERIVEAARRTPSAGFAQGQAIVVVTDAKQRHAIANLAGEPEYLQKGFGPWLSQAPVHMVVLTSRQAYLRRYSEPDKSTSNLSGSEKDWPVPYWWVDAGACLQTLLLAAVNEGLAAGFLGAHALSGLGKLLSIPEEFQPIGIVTIGYPAPDRPSSSLKRGRRPKDEIVHYQHWSTIN